MTDISLPGMNGLELLKNLLTLHPDLPVLVVSRHDEELYAARRGTVHVTTVPPVAPGRISSAPPARCAR